MTHPFIVKPGNFFNQQLFYTFGEKCIESNQELRIILQEHFNLLQIDTVECTGVGLYVNLSYTSKPTHLIALEDQLLAFQDILYINDIESHFDVVFFVEDGIITTIEVVTYGDIDWDGEISSWRFETYN